MIDPNGLVILFKGGSEREIDSELKRLDLRLFLTRERDVYGQDYYQVMFWEGSETPATLILDWREENGRAKPLNSGIIVEVQRMMARGPLDTRAIAERNERLRRERAEASAQHYQDIGEQFARARVMGNLMVMPRSQNLAANARRRRQRDWERKMGLR